MSAKKTDAGPKKSTEISADQVRQYLKAHPEFLARNMDVMGEVPAPERDLGDGVIDFQHFMVKNLQKDSKSLRNRYEVLVDFCRDTMSVQSLVHQAALRVIRAKSLEQLLEALAIDLVSLFDVDVVRMAMESDTRYDTSYGEQAYSGIVFIDPGVVDEAIGVGKNVLLVDDCQQAMPAGFDQIFADCAGMIASCALLRLELETVGKHMLLAFGVRYKERFHPGQGVELLHFLAQIVSHQMDRYLNDLTL
jgi:uncharacterized protein YigA (DUF484 family)